MEVDTPSTTYRLLQVTPTYHGFFIDGVNAQDSDVEVDDGYKSLQPTMEFMESILRTVK